MNGVKDVSYIDSTKDTTTTTTTVDNVEDIQYNARIKQYGTKPAAILSYVEGLLNVKSSSSTMSSSSSSSSSSNSSSSSSSSSNTTNKIIIFSKYETSLRQMESTFKNNGILTLRCGTDMTCNEIAQNIYQYTKHGNSDGSSNDNHNNYNVLLLPCEEVGSGTNLQCTTHIIFLEPAGNNASHSLAIENQCIGRANRIGKTTPLSVVYFLINNTIEMKLYSYLEKVNNTLLLHI
jgi:SNF2 family DNA or RNA helicase